MTTSDVIRLASLIVLSFTLLFFIYQIISQFRSNSLAPHVSASNKIQLAIRIVLSFALLIPIFYLIHQIHPFTSNGIQFAILIVLTFTLLFIAYQSYSNTLALRVSTATDRSDLYMSMITARITQDDVDTMLLHLADYIDVSIYHKHYKDQPERIKSYLLMERKYEYLIYATHIDVKEGIRHVAPGAAIKWLENLCQYYEFRHVHESQRRYYPQFAKVVDEHIEKNPQIIGWMLDIQNQDKTTP